MQEIFLRNKNNDKNIYKCMAWWKNLDAVIGNIHEKDIVLNIELKFEKVLKACKIETFVYNYRDSK